MMLDASYIKEKMEGHLAVKSAGHLLVMDSIWRAICPFVTGEVNSNLHDALKLCSNWTFQVFGEWLKQSCIRRKVTSYSCLAPKRTLKKRTVQRLTVIKITIVYLLH